ncbi:glutaredoxin family protein [Nocardia sp. NPDC049149]|uniref:glutaredoxin family protein n=1 Tax=Nocardia sp. NPDC049149 TaxID=3364315 RepID=UPI00371D6DE6
MLEIAVFGKPGCPQCKTTTQHLDKVGLPYRYRDVTEDQSAHDIVTALGYRGLPVVTVGDLHWSGYRHSRINRLAEIHSTTPDLAVLEPAAIAYLNAEEPSE